MKGAGLPMTDVRLKRLPSSFFRSFNHPSTEVPVPPVFNGGLSIDAI